MELRAEQEADRQALQDALKYEGDTMRHCVGGYCEDVASGRSKIYSLRDAKGQPHVTIETAPRRGFDIATYYSNLPYARRQALDRESGVLKTYTRADGSTVEIGGGIENGVLDKRLASLLEKEFQEVRALPIIVQIKGKQNRAPNPEYLPYVQDFVRSGKWSDVRDLQNTGLRRSRDVWNDLGRAKLQEAGQQFGDYLTQEEADALTQSVWKKTP